MINFTRTGTPDVPEIPYSTQRKLLLIAGLCVAWVLSSAATIVRYAPTHAGLLLGIGCVLVAATFAGVSGMAHRDSDLPGWCVWIPAGLLVMAFLVIYPKTQHLGPGRGSDREDALRVELKAVSERVYPYSVRTYLGDLPTPLPGAMLLASPFYLSGRVSLQNALWAVLFTAAVRRMFARRSTATAVLLVFLVFSLEGLNDFVAGGDYVVNALYLAVAIFLADRSLRAPVWNWQCWLPFLFLGICMASRVCYFAAIFPVFSLSRRLVGKKRAARLCALALAGSAAVTIPIFVPHTVEKLIAYSNQIPGKLHDLPAWLPPSGIEATALLMAAASLWIPMTLSRVYLILAASITMLITPPMFTLVLAQTRKGLPLNHQMVYFTAPSILFALWACAWLEREALRQTGNVPAAKPLTSPALP